MRLTKQTDEDKLIEKHVSVLFKRARKIQRIKAIKKIKTKMKIKV